MIPECEKGLRVTAGPQNDPTESGILARATPRVPRLVPASPVMGDAYFFLERAEESAKRAVRSLEKAIKLERRRDLDGVETALRSAKTNLFKGLERVVKAGVFLDDEFEEAYAAGKRS